MRTDDIIIREFCIVDAQVLGIIDSIGIEAIHPRHEGRSRTALEREGISNHCWIVGIKLAWLINQRGRGRRVAMATSQR